MHAQVHTAHASMRRATLSNSPRSGLSAPRRVVCGAVSSPPGVGPALSSVPSPPLVVCVAHRTRTSPAATSIVLNRNSRYSFSYDGGASRAVGLLLGRARLSFLSGGVWKRCVFCFPCVISPYRGLVMGAPPLSLPTRSPLVSGLVATRRSN